MEVIYDKFGIQAVPFNRRRKLQEVREPKKEPEAIEDGGAVGVGWEQTRWRLVFLLFKEMRGLTN
jgi:hypothetical protein